MAVKIDYIALRAHWGDKEGKRHRYEKGETRTAEPGDVTTEIARKIIAEPETAEAKVAAKHVLAVKAEKAGDQA